MTILILHCCHIVVEGEAQKHVFQTLGEDTTAIKVMCILYIHLATGWHKSQGILKS